MSGGLPWAKIATDFPADPKWKRLERRLEWAEYLCAVGIWTLVVADAWRVGDRVGGLAADGDMGLPEIIGAMVAVGLLNDEGRIPLEAWEKWGGATIREVLGREEQHREISRLGGRARVSQAVRDERGRVQPTSSRDPAGIQPTAGRSPAAHQPSPAKIENQTERENSRSGESPRRTPPARAREVPGVTLTKAQYQAWQTYPGPLWATVRDAWLAKGLRTPPPGPNPEDAPDDPDNDTSPRGRLWRIMDKDPGMAEMVAGWISQAPTTKAGDVLQYVFVQAEERRGQISRAAAKAEAAAGVRGVGAESLAAILGRARATG